MNVSIAKAKTIEEDTDKNGGTIKENDERLSDKSVKEICADNTPSHTPEPVKQESIMSTNDTISENRTSDFTYTPVNKINPVFGVPTNSKPAEKTVSNMQPPKPNNSERR